MEEMVKYIQNKVKTKPLPEVNPAKATLSTLEKKLNNPQT